MDINVYQANLFHTKMLIKEIDLQNYLFNTDVYELPPKTRLAITDSLRKEMIEVFSGSNNLLRPSRASVFVYAADQETGPAAAEAER